MIPSFLLAWRALVRGHVLTLLLAATALAHLLLPALVRSDGTAAGWREMYVRAVTGATFAFTVVTVLVCACGFFAQERARFRLSLTVVRPVPAFAVAAGKWLALCAVAACAYLLTAVLTAVRVPDPPACMHHYAPALPPPAETARQMMAEYLADPKTPEAVKKAPKSAVLSLLTNKELDRYDVVRPGAEMAWPFAPGLASATGLTVRVRFATQFELRAPLAGRFELAGLCAAVSNNTQAVLDIPLAAAAAGAGPADRLRFANTGRETVMLRPRRDLELLTPADPFVANLVRAALQMLATTALLAAFGLFLSSALSRPVAIFTSLVSVFVALMAPSVLVQFPDGLDVAAADRLGLAISRGVSLLASTAGEAEPVSDLATDTCIEWRALARCALVNAALLPTALLALAACLVRRRPLNAQS